MASDSIPFSFERAQAAGSEGKSQGGAGAFHLLDHRAAPVGIIVPGTLDLDQPTPDPLVLRVAERAIRRALTSIPRA